MKQEQMEIKMTVDKMSREDLEMFILSNNDGLYGMFNESKFLSGEYAHQELIDTTEKWIVDGDETEIL